MSEWYLDSYAESLRSKPHGRLLGQVEPGLIKAYAARQKLRDITHLHPSEICKENWCPRASYYTITEVPTDREWVEPSRSIQTLNIFDEGNTIHDKWQQRFWDAGILVGEFYCVSCHLRWSATSPTECPLCKLSRRGLVYMEVPLHSKKYRILGHADAEIADDDGQCLVEIKSVGIGTLRYEAPSLYKRYTSGELTLEKLWAEIKRPFPVHRRQGVLYLEMKGLKQIQFIYEWKPTQAVKEFTVKYDRVMIAPILDGCEAVVKALAVERPPRRPDWARDPDVVVCKNCAYYLQCWSLDEPNSEPVEQPRRRVVRRSSPAPAAP